MKISLVVPCYNEEQNIKPFYDAVNETFSSSDYDYELVFVDDGSSDKTLDELKKLYYLHEKEIKVISFSRNFGKESAIYAGLKQATGDYISLIDADLQQKPCFVLDMLKILKDKPEYDIVAAYQDVRHENVILSGFKKSFYSIINRLSDTKFKSNASDFRTFKKCVADEVIALSETHRFSKGLFSWVGFKTYFMPYTVEERFAGTSKWNFKKLSNYAIEGIVSYSRKPLRIPYYISGFFGLLLFAYIIMMIVGFCVSGTILTGVSIVITLVLLIATLLFASIGIIGEYIGRTFEQSKKRPIYIAKEILK